MFQFKNKGNEYYIYENTFSMVIPPPKAPVMLILSLDSCFTRAPQMSHSN